MKILVIGLGSMGKRRVRCLQKLAIKDVVGFDMRQDRCKETQDSYSIETYFSFKEAINNHQFDAFIISVPPQIHSIYMREAVKHRVPFFVEASVVDNGMEEVIEGVKREGILAAPSATMMFHPAIRMIKEIIEKHKLGKLSNVVFHSGQYLPDWHTYEKVSDFYASKKETGGAREIVPFEMTWFTRIFGFPKKVSGMFMKSIDIEGAEQIDDTYNFLMEHDEFLSTVTVDVVSRFATRKLLVNGSEKQLRWDWSDGFIEIYDPKKGEWEQINYKSGLAEEGYNPNIGEDMYVAEIRNFINALNGSEKFINILEEDHRVLKLLYSIEESYLKGKCITLW